MLLAKLNYDIYDKEFLVIVAAFQEWRVYLKGFKY
jgi:RNase H-like domain found in reverse transcriptase